MTHTVAEHRVCATAKSVCFRATASPTDKHESPVQDAQQARKASALGVSVAATPVPAPRSRTGKGNAAAQGEPPCEIPPTLLYQRILAAARSAGQAADDPAHQREAAACPPTTAASPPPVPSGRCSNQSAAAVVGTGSGASSLSPVADSMASDAASPAMPPTGPLPCARVLLPQPSGRQVYVFNSERCLTVGVSFHHDASLQVCVMRLRHAHDVAPAQWTSVTTSKADHMLQVTLGCGDDRNAIRIPSCSALTAESIYVVRLRVKSRGGHSTSTPGMLVCALNYAGTSHVTIASRPHIIAAELTLADAYGTFFYRQ